ncbi:glycosyltransferase involved in cell wall biosynthesis [Rhizobium rosettiformans]|uniref:Glycosyl transferase, group 1 n=2 Tax=Rhizobium rosettiformans TaxID=1368430 RepID=A0A4S8PK44_9HYPH|nr:rhamnan synthesis F family protein [Rhizobium rosettiformans]MBB5278496.1 glycosyltransferase involved in cell wall biosynthesis [Rhizobium rosettiformans]THV31087.1 glycosyl transferase, group 1 [Rhizobium rosettiformans W3]
MTKTAGRQLPEAPSLWRLTGIDGAGAGLEPALTRPERLVSPDSWAGHLPFAFWLVAAARPRRYVELGVHTGNSYCSIAQAVLKYKLATECFGIDHWYGDVQAGLYGEDVYQDLKAWHDPRFGQFSRLLRMSFADGRAYVEDGSVDILHIDGLHTYEAVREDFETWQSKMSDRGIVLFHDTNVFQSDFGVCDYWQEIKSRYPTFEFLNSNGLGVAYVGTQPIRDVLPDVAGLFRLNEDERQVSAIRRYFSQLGDGHVQAIRFAEMQQRGERSARQLQRAYEDLAALDRDRSAVLAARAPLQDKALKWDQLYVRTGGSISLDLDGVSEALGRLYNSDNPQARRDRNILKRQLTQLVQSGTFEPHYRDLALWAAKRVWTKLATRLRRLPVGEGDATIAAIRDSGLFDEQHYSLTAAARAAGQDPLEHYLQIGEARRISPSKGFDPDYYARRNRDVDQTGFGLLRHFVLFGQTEQRPAVTPAKRMVLPEMPSTQRPRVLLLVEHDTDIATSFAVSVAARIDRTHDVILLVPAGSGLGERFSGVAKAVVFFPDEPDIEGVDRNEVLARIVAELQPSFGVVMSVRSRVNVRGLAAAGLGLVQLVDEFSSSVRPHGSAYEFLPWAHRLVFPSRTVAGSFVEEHPYLSRRQMAVLPPAADPTIKAQDLGFGRQDYQAGVRKLVRPSQHEGDVLVLGYGELTPQSGIEAFIALAAETGARSGQGRSLYFVWVAPDYDGENGSDYARLIAALIKRTGVGDYCRIVSTDADIETVLHCIDIYALTAPMDAMSHNAIAAVRAGKPVVCFESGSSLAEVLKGDETTHVLVSSHLKLSDLSDSVLRLSDDCELYRKTQAACLALSAAVFSSSSYVDRVLQFGEEARQEALAIQQDYQLVQQAQPPVFQEAVFGGSWPVDLYPQDLLHTYLLRSRIARSTSGSLATGLRRPMAGFNPLIYAEDCTGYDGSRDPLADWLEAGRPDGRWTHPLVQPSAATTKPIRATTLLHGHFYYTDLLEDFVTRLRMNASLVDVVITVPDDAKAQQARQVLASASLKGTTSVQVVGNRGRDIGPFLTGLDPALLGRYEIVGHVHGKKSPHVEKLTGDQWRNFLWEHLIGGAHPAADACLAAFEADPKLGLVFPEDAHLHGWDDNLALAEQLAKKMGRVDPLPKAFEWPIGTMFWARTAALKPLFDLKLDWSDYPTEPLAGDGTLLHALERLVPFAVEQAGYGYAAAFLPEVQR